MRTNQPLFGHKKNGIAAALATVAMFLAPTAFADGLAIAPTQLPAAERTKLAAEIAQAKRDNPGAFAALRNVKGHKPETYGQYRNPVPMVSRELRQLGNEALLPMLEVLAFDAPSLAGATDLEREVYVTGLFDAVGRIRDGRAAPVLHAALSATQPGWLHRASAEAMGRLCDAASLERLRVGLADAVRRTSAISGLGQCRSVAAAKLLADELDATVAAEEARVIAKALGALGSSWAWQALGPARKADGDKARGIAAAALVRGYVRFGGSDERSAHRQALTLVEHADSARIVSENGMSASVAVRGELDALAVKIAKRARK